MANKDNQKSEAIKDAEAHGGETYNSEASDAITEQLAPDACPDCKGEGISDPLGLRVCQRCEGSGKLN